AGGGFDAAELVAILLMFVHRPEEALGVLDEAGPDTDEQRGRWLGSRGIVPYWGLTDESTPDRLAAAARDRADRTWPRALESLMRLHHGDLARAGDTARSVLACAASSAGSRALAASTLGHLEAARGSPARTLRAIADLEADAPRWRTEAPVVQVAVDLARGTAALLAGELAAVESTVDGLAAGSAGYLALLRGQVARLRGRLAEA